MSNLCRLAGAADLGRGHVSAIVTGNATGRSAAIARRAAARGSTARVATGTETARESESATATASTTATETGTENGTGTGSTAAAADTERCVDGLRGVVTVCTSFRFVTRRTERDDEQTQVWLVLRI